MRWELDLVSHVGLWSVDPLVDIWVDVVRPARGVGNVALILLREEFAAELRVRYALITDFSAFDQSLQFGSHVHARVPQVVSELARADLAVLEVNQVLVKPLVVGLPRGLAKDSLQTLLHAVVNLLLNHVVPLLLI